MPGVFNALLAQRGIDAVIVPLHVAAEHLATTVTGMRHLRNFAGYGVSMPHKEMAASLCDELLPHARACGVVNHIRVDSDGRWIGETFDGVGLVKALQAQCPLDAHTRVLLVGAGGTGRAIAVALALAGVGSLVITNRTQAKAEEVATTVRRAVPTCAVEAGSAVEPAAQCHVVQGRRRPWPSTDPIPGLSLLRVAPRQSSPGTRRAHPDPWNGLSEVVATVHTGNGGGFDRSCLEPQRGAVLPGTTVAPGADGLKQGTS